MTAKFFWPSDTVMSCEPEKYLGRVFCALVRGRRLAMGLTLDQMSRVTGFANFPSYARHEYADRAINPTLAKVIQVLSPLGGAKLVFSVPDNQVAETEGLAGDGLGPSGDARAMPVAAPTSGLPGKAYVEYQIKGI